VRRGEGGLAKSGRIEDHSREDEGDARMTSLLIRTRWESGENAGEAIARSKKVANSKVEKQQ